MKHNFLLKQQVSFFFFLKSSVLPFWVYFILQVANKLYPIKSIAKQIEDFAKEMLLSVISGDATERTDTEGSVTEMQKVLVFCFADMDFHMWPIQSYTF